jgi:hypothetical protein
VLRHREPPHCGVAIKESRARRLLWNSWIASAKRPRNDNQRRANLNAGWYYGSDFCSLLRAFLRVLRGLIFFFW